MMNSNRSLWEAMPGTVYGFRVLPGLLLAVTLFLCAAHANAQGGGGIESIGTGGRNIINGRIYFPSGRRSDAGLKIRLESSNSGGLSVFSDSNGSFSFRSLEPGNYTVVVEGGDEYESVREGVLIEDTRGLVPGGRADVGRSFTVPIYLQPKRKTVAAAKAAVINAELAGVPAPARDLYSKAAEAARSGDSAKAIEQLKLAIASYPEFGLAQNELGVQYLKIGRPGQAIEPLKAAVKLAPDSFTPRLNYGIALLQVRQFAESESQLKEALKKNGNSAIAHMYLGLLLISGPASDEIQKDLRYSEAEKEFLRSIEIGDKQVATSHFYLGGIYWRNRQYKKAADELETYLKLAPNAPEADRKRAADSIAELRKKR
jgi:Tfp pilus assembly protein PilF